MYFLLQTLIFSASHFSDIPILHTLLTSYCQVFLSQTVAAVYGNMYNARLDYLCLVSIRWYHFYYLFLEYHEIYNVQRCVFYRYLLLTILLLLYEVEDISALQHAYYIYYCFDIISYQRSVEYIESSETLRHTITDT